MDIEDLKIAFAEHPQIKAIEERITKKGDRHVLVSGLYASSRSLVLERLSQILSRKKATRGESLFIIMDNAESAQYLYSDLCQVQRDKGQGTKVLFFPAAKKRRAVDDAAMIMGLVYTSILFMVVPIIGVMDSLDNSLIEAAYDLGAKKAVIWRQIIIPHCMPGIISGCIIVFMMVLGSYLTPNLMGGKNSMWFTEQIYNQFILYRNWNMGSAFGFLLLFMSSIIIWVALKLSGQSLKEVVK